MQPVRITSNLEIDNRTLQVVLWDLGPSVPEPPTRPEVPTGKEGDPKFDLAMIEFRQQMEDYEAALKVFGSARKEYAAFQKQQGGPIERIFWSCDAQDALARDPKRYCISSSTRGYEKLKNRGLPIGVKPGHGQAENERRAAEGAADLAAAQRADPVFGAVEARQ